MSHFIGRQEEFERLLRLNDLKKSSLVVVKGRRRVGKSTLIEEFAKGKTFISLSGLAPTEGITDQMQRDAFGDQLASQLHLPKVTFLSWHDAFHFLGKQISDKETVVLLDEISWMAGLDPTFLSTLKTWWDQTGKKKRRLILVLCSSVSIWMEENLLQSTAFVGRITLTLHLQPLTLPQSAALLKARGFALGTQELLKILSITGGIPWYLELINPKESADKNIAELCFHQASALKNEFQIIFHDLFNKDNASYRKILYALVDGMKTREQIRDFLGFQEGGTLSKYLNNLIEAGFVSSHYQWAFKKSALGKQKLYRLSDCFLRFHLKYVEANQELISQSKFKPPKLPGWDSLSGFQLENLLLNNRDLLLQALKLEPEAVFRDNPFIQRATSRRPGCQIDYLIETKVGSVIACEFKFSKNALDLTIVKEMKTKLDRLALPKGLGKSAALFHCGGVSEAVIESDFFYKIVDLRDWVEG